MKKRAPRSTGANKKTKTRAERIATFTYMPDIHLPLIEQLAEDGCTQLEIAHSLGIHANKMSIIKKANPEIEYAIQLGRVRAIHHVSNALKKSALDGNVAAQIFFLKNRSPAAWQDRREYKQTVTQEISVNTNQLSDEVMRQLVQEKRGDVDAGRKVH